MAKIVGYCLDPKKVHPPLPGGQTHATQVTLLLDDGTAEPHYEFWGFSQDEADDKARAEGESKIQTG